MGDEVGHKSTLHFVLLTLTICMGSFFFGYNLGVLNEPLHYLSQYKFGLNDSWYKLFESMASSFLAIGAAIGCMSTGLLLNTFSRNKSMMVTDAIGIIGCSICFIDNPVSFIIGRLIAGIAVGFNSAIVPTILNEWIPDSLRNILLNMNSIFINGGIVISNLIGRTFAITKAPTQDIAYPGDWPEIPSSEWQLVVCVAPLVACIFRSLMIAVYFQDETPLYLLKSNRNDMAQSLIERLYEDNSTQIVFQRLMKQVEGSNQSSLTYTDMYTQQRYQKRLLIGVCLQLIQQFSGINAVIFFSTTIFASVTNNDLNTDFTLVILVGFTLTSTSLLAGIVLKYLGRKQIMVIGDIVCIASLGGLAFLQFINEDSGDKVLNVISIISIFVYLFGFGVSMGPIPWLYNSEILPDQGVALATLANWTGVIIITFTFPQVVGDDNQYIGYIFLFFAACCGLGLLFILRFVVETQNLSPAEIQAAFSDEKKSFAVETSEDN